MTGVILANRIIAFKDLFHITPVQTFYRVFKADFPGFGKMNTDCFIPGILQCVAEQVGKNLINRLRICKNKAVF